MAVTATVPMKPAIAPAPSRAGSVSSPGDADASRVFGGHLDAARHRRGSASSRGEHDAKGVARDDATSSPAKDAKASASDTAFGGDPAAAGTVASRAVGTAKSSDTAGVPSAKGDTADKGDGDTATAGTAAQAAAMLALLGQARPAAASASTGADAKVVSASVLKTAGGKLADDLQPAALDASAADDASAALAGAQGRSPSTPGTFAATLDAAPVKALAHKGAHEPSGPDLASLASMASQPAVQAPATPVHALQIASPAGSPAFAQELGQQVAWLGGQDLKQARIRLHPEELGQLDVKLSVTHNQVDVTFAVQHPAAVHAVQQTLAQLDTLLAQHGLSLGHAEVGQQQSRNDSQRGGSSGVAAIDADGESFAAQPQVTPTAIGLLDTFA